jgi:hypothetical protein
MSKRVDFFPDSPITDRVLSKMSLCPQYTLNQLARENLLRNPQKALNYYSFIMDGLEAYADASNSSLHYFLFGDAPVQTTYTENDAVVLRFLNEFCTEQQLKQVFDIVQKMYPNSFYYTANEFASYRHRISTLINRLPWGTLRTIPLEPESSSEFILPAYKKVSDLLLSELQRFIRGHRCYDFAFHTDVLPDLATYLGVSLHWILNFKKPLFCTTAIGDAIFDYYTLMQPDEQQEFCSFISNGVQYHISKLSAMFSNKSLT